MEISKPDLAPSPRSSPFAISECGSPEGIRGVKRLLASVAPKLWFSRADNLKVTDPTARIICSYTHLAGELGKASCDPIARSGAESCPNLAGLRRRWCTRRSNTYSYLESG
jgi:hypothetical protein